MEIGVDEDEYRMNHRKIGVCVIINNCYFDKTTGMSDRTGTDVDAANLYQLFMGLGFDVRLEHNKSTTDMMRILSGGKAGFNSWYSLT